MPGSSSAGTLSVRTHNAGDWWRIESGFCSSCLIVFLSPNSEHLPVVGQRCVVALHAIFCAVCPIRFVSLILVGIVPDRIRRVSPYKSPRPSPVKHGTAAADVQNTRDLRVTKKSSNDVVFPRKHVSYPSRNLFLI